MQSFQPFERERFSIDWFFSRGGWVNIGQKRKKRKEEEKHSKDKGMQLCHLFMSTIICM